MNKAILDISFTRLTAMLLPVPLRKTRIMTVVAILSGPFAALLVELKAFREDKLQRLRYNGQTCRLEYALNCLFGNTEEIDNLSYDRRIRILDGTDRNGDPYIIYRRDALSKYEFVKRRGADHQIILNRRAVNCQTFYDFIVECPVEYQENKKDEIRAVVNTYKTQGKTWLLKDKQ